MNTYTVRYEDRNPLDPQARFEIHRANVDAETADEARGIMEDCDCEVIDVVEYDEVAYTYGANWEQMADALRDAFGQMEIEADQVWLSGGEPCPMPHVCNEFTVIKADAPRTTPDISRARSIALDENGNLRPYSSFPRYRGKLVDDHEIHSYTADGE